MTESETLSPALQKLLGIMTSPDVPVDRSIEAAKAIIEYEAPPEVFELTYQFLMGVANDPKADVGLQLEALKLIRKVEARRVSPGTTKGVDPMDGLGKRLEEARLRAEARRKLVN
ncbi:hypothetical protein NLY43_24125 [Mesorhizobium sp. C416B]|uniref:hypothetical protein n=1 Tax=unclassified Mesorhizobium TaxID=325217 RepID=UPI0003CE186C|nr:MULTISPECIES: hypothetical protein [unclassified Mesorhizobium]ESX48815.1 hypothetical protein X762_10960 [Mesorhizobium sp. LSHC426A00]ESX55553.1 hypothetical protein X761_14045 [Mesorhizobium sp. LSHC424B00]ESX70292.1 hypothetical protein X758_16870 [Mesorhizobium sp. LSHC416B00]WJI61674.1 hypothetical protein NLY43_24125 [Mesorhizobium sp. C416B]